MSIYKKNEWIDHIEDIETGELLQEGTLYCARLMNNMEDGIYDAHIEIIDIFNRLEICETKIKILEDNLVNNMPHNNFYEDFSNLDDINIIAGSFNEIYKKVYA